jgi:hypothetical protein
MTARNLVWHGCLIPMRRGDTGCIKDSCCESGDMVSLDAGTNEAVGRAGPFALMPMTAHPGMTSFVRP